jgi:histidyl-tRNA synthetase
MAEIYSGIRGTHDFNPQETSLFNTIIQRSKGILKLFGYEEIMLPILEEEAVFTRSLGETTDIVEKQMFRIEGKDTPTVLRPEGTAQVVRYYVQNALDKQGDFHKFSYIGPMFRGERPQKGRLRQFHHIGVEAFGSNSPYLDAEIIVLSMNILTAIGITERELHINSLGCSADKKKFKEMFKKALLEDKNSLCEDCKRRLDKNPLRVLDCKQEQCKKIIKKMGDHIAKEGGWLAYLCPACQEHFSKLMNILNSLGIKYQSDWCLVRGLDYYTNTVFEITSSALGSQDALGAGGRYDNLVKALGGPDIPAIGFALGIERIILALNQSPEAQKLQVFIAVMGEEAAKKGLVLLQEMRNADIICDMDYCAKSLKAQLRYAQNKGARIVVILGDEELKEGTVIVKDMKASVQEKIKEVELIGKLKNMI